MTIAIYWLPPAILLSLAVGYFVAWIRTNVRRDAEEAKWRLRAKQEAYWSGEANGWFAATARAAKVLETSYPTSRGGKAIVRALNAGPEAPAPTMIVRDVPGSTTGATELVELPPVARPADGPETP